MTPASNPVWAYVYMIDPPQPAARLQKIKVLLSTEHRAAAERSSTFEGRLITDERISHILVVSDSPDADREVNCRIEAALRALDERYSRHQL